MAFWVGIPERCYRCSVILPVIHRGSPLHLNEYTSHHRFNEILASIRYTNREVNYEDGLFHMKHIEEVWNKNMADRFDPSWINVLN